MIDMSRDIKQTDNSISRAADRKNQYYSLLYSEMAERRRVEENLRRSNLLLQALSQAQLQYVAGNELGMVFSSLLRTLLAVTQAHQGYLREQHIANDTPDSSYLCIREGNIDGFDDQQLTTIADQVLHTGQTILQHPANQPEAYSQLTLGTTPYYCLGLPIAIAAFPNTDTPTDLSQADESIVGTILISGPAEEFDPSILEQMQPLVSTCAQLIVAHRNDARRRVAELALVEERSLLAQRVAERTAELSFSNAELARAARAKDEFLATMNHELRTPLNAVLLYAESLQTQLPGPLNARQLRAAGGIRESAHHLLLLINDILDVAKMDAGKLSLDIISAAVENVCQSSLRLVSEMAQKKRLDVSFDCSPTITKLDVDERRLKQMLVNLLGNAIKFTPEGGKIGLEVTGDKENDTVCFTVWDTGIGLSKEDAKKLFQPFVQIDSGHSRHHGGTGLGLFLVYRMAELHGGSISVTSELNQGSRFAISLPWHHRKQSFQMADLMPATATQKVFTRVDVTSTDQSQNNNGNHAPSITISKSNDSKSLDLGKGQIHSSPIDHLPIVLLADDNEANLRVLSDFLEEWECQILIARTGVEAVQQAKEEHPNLILMDIQMPEMNGLDAIRMIRGEPSLATVTIVALTALAMPGDREQCLAAGADDYLSKPLQIERLTEILNVHLRTLPAKEPR